MIINFYFLTYLRNAALFLEVVKKYFLVTTPKYNAKRRFNTTFIVHHNFKNIFALNLIFFPTSNFWKTDLMAAMMFTNNIYFITKNIIRTCGLGI